MENEIHFVITCPALKSVRKPYLKSFREETGLTKRTDKHVQLKCMIDADNITKFSVWLEEMYHARRNIIYRQK